MNEIDKTLKAELDFCKEKFDYNNDDSLIYHSANGNHGISLPAILQDYKEWLIKKNIVSEKPVWIDFDFDKIETRPPKYDKYFVQRKDGKIHWETWNGSGWAYNGNAIIRWCKIEAPKI